MKLKSKFITLFMIFAIVPVLISGFIIQYSIRRNTYNDAADRLKVQCETTKKSMEDTIDFLCKINDSLSKRSSIVNLTKTINSGKANIKDMENVQSILNNNVERYSDIKDITIADKNGLIRVHNDSNSINIDINEFDYYKKMKETKKQVLSDVKKSSIDGKPTLVIATPIIDNNEFVGTILTDISLTNMSKNYIKDISIGEGGFIFIIQKDASTVAHPKDDELLTKNFLKVDISSKILSTKNGVDEYSYNGAKKFTAYTTDNKLGWTYIATIPLSQITKSGDLAFKIFICVSILSAITALILAILISKKLSESIIRVSDAMKNVSDGDFTVTLPVTGNDEITDMSSNINNTLGNIIDSFATVREASNLVNDNSLNLKNSTDEMFNSASEVASAIQEIAKGTTEQSSQIFDIVCILEEFSKELSLVQNNLLTVNTNVSESASKALTGKDEIHLLIDSIQEIVDSFNAVTFKINGLSDTVSKIGNITDAINRISEQTNLLALNAAIEAARAGEHGKGFAVVAEEVRNLAEESKNSSKEILELIKSISEETNDVISTTNNVKDLLANQQSVANNTTKTFENIINSVQAVEPLTKKTILSLEGANKSKDSIENKLQDISALSEEVSASAEEISASAEELLASTETLSELSNQMDDTANDLRGKINMFKID